MKKMYATAKHSRKLDKIVSKEQITLVEYHETISEDSDVAQL